MGVGHTLTLIQPRVRLPLRTLTHLTPPPKTEVAAIAFDGVLGSAGVCGVLIAGHSRDPEAKSSFQLFFPPQKLLDGKSRRQIGPSGPKACSCSV